VINVKAIFPAQRFGQTTNAPSTRTTYLIKATERIFDKTLLTKRQAQCRAIENIALFFNDSNIDYDQSYEMDTEDIIKRTFDISDSGYRSLKSTMEQRKRDAFQTVRELSDSDDFNYVMEEFAETIDELGQLAILGSEYRRRQGKSPGFY
jgi:hypothetical protein